MSRVRENKVPGRRTRVARDFCAATRSMPEPWNPQPFCILTSECTFSSSTPIRIHAVIDTLLTPEVRGSWLHAALKSASSIAVVLATSRGDFPKADRSGRPVNLSRAILPRNSIFS